MRLRDIALTLKYAFFTIAVIYTFAVSASAAEVIIRSAVAQPTRDNPNHWQISLVFSHGFDVPAQQVDFEDISINLAKNPANYRIIDFETGQQIQVTYVSIDFPQVAGERPFTALVFLDPSVRLARDHPYHIYVLNLTYNGEASDSPPQTAVQFPKNALIKVTSTPDEEGRTKTNTKQAPAPEEEKNDKELSEDSISATAADGRDDANVYISGEINGARGTKFTRSVDVKLEYPFRKVIWKRIHYFKPFFEAKVASGPEADPDSLSFGLRWEFPALRYRGDNLKFPIRRVILQNAPKIEADKDFDNVNFAFDTRFRFVSRSYISRYATFYFRPFIGQEIGTNLKSPVLEAEKKFLYRPLIGTTLNLIFPMNKSGIEEISFDGSYIRRWLLRKEIGFEEDEDGNLRALTIGRGPRDYVKTNFNLNFTKSFGFTVSYEYGRIPPSFKLVDSKTSVGLTYKIKFER